MSEQKHNDGWYCPKCSAWVNGMQVTHAERHEICGCSVLTFNPQSEVDKLRSVNKQLAEALEAVNARYVDIQQPYINVLGPCYIEHQLQQQMEAALAAWKEVENE